MNPDIRNQIRAATETMMAAMKPESPFSVHTMLAVNMIETYSVYLAWYEGKTKYSVIGHYNAHQNIESPEEWVDRALRAEVAGRGESTLPEGVTE